LTSASSYATQTFGVTSNIAGENPGAAGLFLMPSYQQARSSFQDVLDEYRYRREEIWHAASFTLSLDSLYGKDTFICSREDHLSPAGGHIRYSQVVFMRCSALGMVHVGYNSILEDAVAYADRLDARVAPIACQ
jgi:hypothetical protein